MRKSSVLLSISLAILLGGCKQVSPFEQAIRAGSLTSQGYTVLPDADKVRYKNVILRVPSEWGGAQLPLDKGPYLSPVDKAIHNGDIGPLIGIYNQALFELQNPRVKVDYINFDINTFAKNRGSV